MKTQESVVEINFEDRPGLGFEIFKRFEDHHIDKIGMEVVPQQGMVIKFCFTSEQDTQSLICDLETVPGVKSVKLRDYMPYEHREHELRTILNSVNEGIIAVNKEGIITHINQVASEIFHQRIEDTVGMKAEVLFEADPSIFETLKTGKPYSLKERKIQKGKRVIHFLTSGVPVINDKGHIIGEVITIKDFRQVEEIISKIDRQTKVTTFEQIICQSPLMQQLIDTSKMVAKGNSTILLRGESGTGKEMFAKAIHFESPRSKAPFIPINCAALPDTLLESELFGYEEGAFTGAVKGGKKGLFEQANGGTLFLDEIGEVSLPVQVRLLRVLQEGTIRRVGGSKEISVDVRIIAATHRNLEVMIQDSLFREDLYYRLNVIPLRIPPLRDRSEDIPLIAQSLIRKISGKLGKSQVYLTRESMDLLVEQAWPGNVRQLENMLERIINITDTTEIKPESFYQWTDLTPPPSTLTTEQEQFIIKIPLPKQWPPLKEIVNEVEKQVLEKVLESHQSSRKAGQVLGVSNTTILNKVKEYGLKIKQE
ncbi:sigma 54-interacting transcriptional regulator [Desulfosporosinus acidiphilus]